MFRPRGRKRLVSLSSESRSFLSPVDHHSLPKSFLKASHKLPAPLVEGVELAQEEPEDGRLGDELQSVDQLAVLVEPLEPVDDVFDMRDRIDPSGNGDPGQLQVGVDVVPVLVAVHGDRAPFHRPDPRGDVERGDDGPGDIALLGGGWARISGRRYGRPIRRPG